MVASKLILAAIAFGPVAAGPCRPSPTKVLSSTTGFSSSSTVSFSDSSLSSGPTYDASTSKELGPETTTNTAAETSLISVTVTFESTTTTIPTDSTDSQGTVPDATSDIKTETTAEGKSTMETTPTNDITSTTLESTTEGSGSASTATVTTGTATTEPTTTIAESTVESESSSVQSTATSEATTKPTEAITTTTEATTATTEPTTTTEATTTTAAETTTTEATTTTTSMEPVSTTFNLLVQGGAMANGVALYSNGQDALVLNSQASGSWLTSYSTAPLSYDPITQHLLLGNKRLCLMYNTIAIASFAVCQGPPSGQYFELTCDDPSAGSLRCNVPAKQYISKDNIFVDTGGIWNQFYLLEVNRQFSPGVYRIIIGKDNLSSTDDIKYQAFERITVGTKKV